MHRRFERNAEMAETGLEQLRLQLQHMRADDERGLVECSDYSLPQPNNCEYGDENSRAIQVPATVWPFNRWAQRDDCNSDVHPLHRLGERFRLLQENGVKRRGELVYVVGTSHRDVEQLDYYSEQSQLHLSKQLQELRDLLSDATDLIETIAQRPEIVMKEVFAGFHSAGNSFVCTHEKDAQLVSRVSKMQGTLDFIQRKLQRMSSRPMLSNDFTAAEVIWTEMSSERERAETKLLRLKELFVSIVQETLDNLEQLRRERIEAEEQCTRILS